MQPATDNPGVIAPPPLIALGALVLGLLLDWLAPAYLLSLALSLADRIVLGGILLAAGIALAFAGAGMFHAARTNVPPWKPALALVTTGIYRWLRNPMYVGLLAILAGIAVMLASDWILVLTVGTFFVFHFGVVLREERYLSAKFGQTYDAYRARVPRYGWPF